MSNNKGDFVELPEYKIFARFNGLVEEENLPSLLNSLYSRQISNWSLLANAYDAFANVKTRVLQCDTFSVILQWNPQRLHSTQANVDPEAVRTRRCFLCYQNLFPEQQGIVYKDRYFILLNPAPIFDRHCTVVTIEHREQVILPHFSSMLELSRDIDNKYTVLYNGPACGASAPDHFHFQLIPWRSLPVEKDVVEPKRRKVLHYQPHLSLVSLKQYGRAVLVIESDDKEILNSTVERLFTHWKTFTSALSEPMVNIVCSYQEGMWRALFFPRKKHRPAAYYLQGENQLLISPGAIDMGGVLITPRQKEFDTLTAESVQMIFEEVSEQEEFVERLVAHFHQ
jgi:diadenosine tetraphosphate (Ap4A) HIT family hydrolase